MSADPRQYPDLRARALLELAEGKIAERLTPKLRGDDPDREARADELREEFVTLLHHARRMAAGLGLEDVIDGEPVRAIGPVKPLDWRTHVVDRLAELCRQPLAPVDARAAEMIREHERGLSLADAYMSKLPKPPRQMSTHDGERPSRKRAVYNDLALRELLPQLPDESMAQWRRELAGLEFTEPHGADGIDEWA